MSKLPPRMPRLDPRSPLAPTAAALEFCYCHFPQLRIWSAELPAEMRAAHAKYEHEQEIMMTENAPIPMRVIRSSVNAVDPEVDEDAYETARLAGEVVRETYSRDEIGQKLYVITLTAYVDPTGARRWAVAAEDPSEVDVLDTDDLDRANAEYERTVRDLAIIAVEEYDDDGNKVPTYDYTDVPGVSARKSDPVTESPTARSLLIAARWASATTSGESRS